VNFKKFKALPVDCKFKYIYRGSILLLSISCFLALISIGYMIYPGKVVDIINFEVYELVNDSLKSYQIHAGDEIEFEIYFKKYIDATANVTVLLKQVDNGYLYPYTEYKITRMPTGEHHYRSSLLIPKATPKGKYVIIRSYKYNINNLRTVDIEAVSNIFEVLPPGKSPLKLIEEGNITSLQNKKVLEELKKSIKK